jgi:hypothetical protein
MLLSRMSNIRNNKMHNEKNYMFSLYKNKLDASTYLLPVLRGC